MALARLGSMANANQISFLVLLFCVDNLAIIIIANIHSNRVSM
ncbi:hypothetical protein EV11_1500 [Prochlorococcus sp. SS52]|nr:hypothetical protein EV04_0258 [Prochlorococcus marinus str. LG]KGG18908.1 hypothetical protein EV08_1395 [Prochlorococcus marinus str. SS2]KGG23554.1 hypothetical protein EV09_1178 [Prochlorococcus marinus str. SS35]KGG32210.1 hypothetical protein EV10_1325 [Prochlorococcus marinus str. SS51]KGG35098.1 hypothetical protein EV11_1500 [Prochlorococcus sp. SS52]